MIDKLGDRMKSFYGDRSKLLNDFINNANLNKDEIAEYRK